MMEVSVLASGSSGNCFLINGSRGAILVDAGISCKQICLRARNLGIDVSRIRGVFLTHEHGDHVRGVDVFARNFNVPVFGTAGTFGRFVCSNDDLLNVINEGEMDFAGFKINTFSKSHKANDPVSFSIFCGGKMVSVITDLGYACDNVKRAVKKSDFLCLESNYDLEMLENGGYPYFLKKWISGVDGHLSNVDSARLVLENGGRKLKGVVLSHLSENNNSPGVALDTWREIVGERFNIGVSTRDCTELFRV